MNFVLPFLETSNSTRFSKFCISGGRRWISLSLKPSFLNRFKRKKFWKNDRWLKNFRSIHRSNKKITFFIENIIHGLTFGRSRIWFASRRSSSKLLAYRIISSGTVLRVQCRLSTYSTCRLHPFKKPGTHLNILESFLVEILLKRLHLDKILLTSQHYFVVAHFIS